MTDQQLFDTTIAHLVRQGMRAMASMPTTYDPDSNACAYRTPEGLKCAIGIHITDDCYRPVFENQGVRALLLNEPCVATLFEGNTESLLTQLQFLHDSLYSWDEDEKKFRDYREAERIATDHGLIWNLDYIKSLVGE